MNKNMKNAFGEIKTKILSKLVESYSSENKNNVKDILKLLNENKDLKEMYLFYEQMEKMELSSPDSAKLYVEMVEPMLVEKTENIKKACNKINEIVKNIESEKNELYECLDILSEKPNIFNVDKKIVARKNLIEHLKKEKKEEINESTVHTSNEKLLMTILSNDFNSFYGKTLNENDKNKLKEILNYKQEDIELKTKELTETIYNKIENILNESTDTNISEKLCKVKEEVENIKPSKYNYYRLLQLKNGLD